MRTLDPYQRDLLFSMLALAVTDPSTRLVRRFARKRKIGVAYPQGSGKTLLALCLAALLLGRCQNQNSPARAVTHVIVAVPQNQIANGWMEETTGGLIRAGDFAIDLSCLTVDYRGDWSRTVQAIIEYLKSDNRDRKVLLVTHMALSRPEILEALATFTRDPLDPVGLLGCVLVIDEAHHNRAPKLGPVKDKWVERDGTVVDLTATPYTTKGDVIMEDESEAKPDCITFRRSYTRHAEEGFAPKNIETEVVPVAGLRAELVEAVVRAMIAQWEKDGRPKVIIRIPVINALAGSKEENAEVDLVHREILKRLFEEFNALIPGRVFNASSTHSDGSEFSEMLTVEQRVKRFEDSQYHVVLACRRMDEGTNWPLACAVYFFDLPSAMWQIEQVFGRATRSKKRIANYPPEWFDRVRLVFFPPATNASGSLIERHRKDTFITACLLSSHKIGEHLTAFRAARDALHRFFGCRPTSRRGRRLTQTADDATVIPPEIEAKLEAAWLALPPADRNFAMLESFVNAKIEQADKSTTDDIIAGPPSFFGDVSSNGADAGTADRVPEVEVAKFIAAKAIAQKGPNGDKARTGYSSLFERLNMDADMKAGFEAIVIEFAKEHVQITDEGSDVAHLHAKFTASDADKSAAKCHRLFKLGDTPIDFEKFKSCILAYRAAHKSNPNAKSGPVEGMGNLTWFEGVHAIVQGKRFVPTQQAGSWAKFLIELGREDNWVDRYHRVIQAERLDLHEPDAAIRKRLKKYPSLDVNNAPALLRAVFVFPSLCLELSAGGRGPELCVALGVRWFFKGLYRRRVRDFEDALIARTHNGEAFKPSDLARELRAFFKEAEHAAAE